MQYSSWQCLPTRKGSSVRTEDMSTYEVSSEEGWLEPENAIMLRAHNGTGFISLYVSRRVKKALSVAQIYTQAFLHQYE